MAHFNQCTFIGNLGKEPKLEVAKEGAPLTKFSLAVWQGKNIETMWLNVVCWNELAEKAERELDKGSKVFVQGRLQMKSYTDKQGIKRQSLDLVATTVQPLDKKADTPEEQGNPL